MTARSLFVAFVLNSFIILWISMGGVAVHAQTASATAEDLVVLNEATATATAQNQANATPTSDRPAIASDKLILDNPVIDEAYILTASEKTHLENQLRQIYHDNLAQMALVIVPTTDGVDIFDYAIATANRWGLGKKDTDDGILMLVAINDRQLYIVTGYGVEGVLPDVILKRIIRDDITPSFKSGQYAQGMSAGIARIDERLRADPETLTRANKTDEQPVDTEINLLMPFIFAFIFGTILKAIFGRFIGSSLGAMGFIVIALMAGVSFATAVGVAFFLWIWLLVSRARSSGGRSGGFGGGSFGGGGGFGGGGFSGGGGSFGGGGAGGSW
ncbi:MAG: TPM domain-containing protein [Moraxella sp.]|nr:TPM domain-containing protein [Moraxella sp.]